MLHPHNKKLLLFIKSENLTIKEFSKIIEVEYDKLNKYINGTTKNPGINLVIAVLSRFSYLNVRWWLCDEGEMKKGREVSENAVVLEKEKFDQMQSEMIGYLKSGNEALKEINALQKENSQLKEQITQLQQK